MWTETLLKLSPSQEMEIATNPRFSSAMRGAAYVRYEIKKWYELVVLAPVVKLDLNELPYEVAVEVVSLRTQAGSTAPWLPQKELSA